MRPTARGPRTILLFLDRVVSYTRSMFAGMAAYAVEHGPWQFVPVAAPGALISALATPDRYDGVLARVLSGRMADSLAGTDVPVVSIRPIQGSNLPVVALDDAEVGRLGARHLIQSESPSLAYCGQPWLWYSPLRESGFMQVANEAGRKAMVFGHPTSVQLSTGRVEHEAKLDEWLTSLPKPVGLMACDDLRARDVAESCRRLNLRVPQDVAIIGAGNDPLICDVVDPPLTSIALAADRVGFEAARLLAHLMDGQPAPAAPKIFPPAGVVMRFSTKIAASDDSDVAEAVEFIRDQVHEGITVEDVLRAVPVSRRTLEMRFRAALGRSPAEEIRRIRIERAKRLLVDTDATMAGVAQASGFSSANQLCETFRREAGLSPTRYRRQFRAG